jgi:cytochrome P450
VSSRRTETLPAESPRPTAQRRSKPPGPRGWPIIGNAVELLRDSTGFLTHLARKYGDIVHFPLIFQTRILLSDPALIEEIFVRQPQKFEKGPGLRDAAQRLLGEGLLTAEGDLWLQQRRLAQPAFHRQRIAEYAQTMVNQALFHIRDWKEGDRRDIAEEMMALTLEIAVRTLFGTEFTNQAKPVGKAVTRLMRYQIRRMRSPIKIPPHWPTPSNRSADRDYKYLDSLVYGIIEARRDALSAGHAPQSDLLSLLMAATDEWGGRMNTKQLRDEVMTLFIAGHETTAVTLGWTWHLLSQNPRVEQKLHAELDSVLHGAAPSLDQFRQLPYLDAVIHEAQRVFPAAYIIQRTCNEPVTLGGYSFPRGTTFLMSQWVLHRDPRYFDSPDEFHPERWLDGLADRLPAFAYFPFGGGPRKCIGQAFAQMELAIVVSLLAQRFRFVRDPSANGRSSQIALEPLVTLRARHGIPLVLHSRTPI